LKGRAASPPPLSRAADTNGSEQRAELPAACFTQRPLQACRGAAPVPAPQADTWGRVSTWVRIACSGGLASGMPVFTPDSTPTPGQSNLGRILRVPRAPPCSHTFQRSPNRDPRRVLHSLTTAQKPRVPAQKAHATCTQTRSHRLLLRDRWLSGLLRRQRACTTGARQGISRCCNPPAIRIVVRQRGCHVPDRPPAAA
jgi:hypothetical protein